MRTIPPRHTHMRRQRGKHVRLRLPRSGSGLERARNFSNSPRSCGVNCLNRLIELEASFWWRRIACSKDSDFKSCMNRDLVRTPQSAAVRNLCCVSCGPPWTMPSPVPTSWSKVAKGMNDLAPKASGMVKSRH